jgi:hypothetical protein
MTAERFAMTIKSVGLSVLLLLGCDFARADWRFDAETGVLYNSNLSNSDRESDEEDDFAWKTHVSATQGWQLTRDLRATVSADLRGQVMDHYDAFNEIGVGLNGNLRYRFGLGRKAPWILLQERFGYDRFHETERSGWDETFSFRGGLALSERIAVEAGYTFDNVAVPDNFFDVQSHTVDVRVVADLTSSLRVALGYSYREGDVISYAIPPRPDIAPIAVEREDVSTFGTDPRYTAYRFPGRTNAISVSIAYALTKYASAQLTYEYAVTSRDPLQYENHLVEAKVAFAY